jgi:hypothetical protein
MGTLTDLVLKPLGMGALFYPIYTGLTSVVNSEPVLKTAADWKTVSATAGCITATLIVEGIKKWAKKKVQHEEEGAFYKDYFLGHLDKWQGHYESLAGSSMVEQMVDCDSYRDIVRMGRSVLSLVYDEAKNAKKGDALYLCLPRLVAEIAGDEFQMPGPIQGKVDEMHKYTLGWLKENI